MEEMQMPIIGTKGASTPKAILIARTSELSRPKIFCRSMFILITQNFLGDAPNFVDRNVFHAEIILTGRLAFNVVARRTGQAMSYDRATFTRCPLFGNCRTVKRDCGRRRRRTNMQHCSTAAYLQICAGNQFSRLAKIQFSCQIHGVGEFTLDAFKLRLAADNRHCMSRFFYP